MTRGFTIRWLGWAGIEIEAEGESLVIDLLGSPDGVLAGTGVEAPMPRVVTARTAGDVAAGLCTHLHRDHTDAGALSVTLRPGAPVRGQRELAGAGELPPWLGDDAVHRSHRSALVRKDPAVYADLFPGEPDDLPYVWPSSDRDPEAAAG